MPVHGPYLLVSAIALCIECYALTYICDSQILCNFVVYPLLITLKL